MNMPIDERELQTLLDKQALADLNTRYARGIDRKDYALLRSLYHPDATDDHGESFSGPASAYVDWLETALPGMVTQHFMTNMLFAIDGDRAEGEIYSIRYHVIDRDGKGPVDIISGGRYLDRYVREDGCWYFMHRAITQEWEHRRRNSNPEAWQSGLSTFPDDPSYAMRLLSGGD
jgi:hypothetical protein